MKRLKWVLCGIIWIGYFFYADSVESNQLAAELEKSNLVFSGVVTNIKEVNGYNGYGIITLRILNSNTQVYDPRDAVKYYYCIIKNDVAEVYDHAFARMIRDTLNINTSKRIMSIGSRGNEKEEGSIHINPNEGYFNYISQNSIFAVNKNER